MSYAETIHALYPNAVEVGAFARWTADVLAPHGFDRYNTLTLVAACRDELMFEAEHALREVWGAGFDVSALGAMVFLGRTGMAAAASHSPGLDGRRRYAMFVLPHIGISPRGAVGLVERLGQTGTSTACGALVVLQRELEHGGGDAGTIDPGDIEMSLLRHELSALVEPGPAPSLTKLTELARQHATEVMTSLTAHLLAASDADVAMFSGVVVHGPHTDHVAVAEAWVNLGSSDERVALSAPPAESSDPRR